MSPVRRPFSGCQTPLRRADEVAQQQARTETAPASNVTGRACRVKVPRQRRGP